MKFVEIYLCYLKADRDDFNNLQKCKHKKLFSSQYTLFDSSRFSHSYSIVKMHANKRTLLKEKMIHSGFELYIVTFKSTYRALPTV